MTFLRNVTKREQSKDFKESDINAYHAQISK